MKATGDGGVPAQLPADVRAFTVRDAELAALDALLPEPAGPGDHPAGPGIPVVCAVTGPGGVGKTALVVRWAHRVRDRFPDGQLHVNLRGYDPDRPVTADAALAGLLHSLGAGRLPQFRRPQPDRAQQLPGGTRLVRTGAGHPAGRRFPGLRHHAGLSRHRLPQARRSRAGDGVLPAGPGALPGRR